ncbi:hypothetical protein [uncultured Mediterranean phage uvMED]|nr:hypothetical protein [uncultured Mediterranean phage uvMED]
MSSELKLTNIKHPSSGSNNLVLASDGTTTVSGALTASGGIKVADGGNIGSASDTDAISISSAGYVIDSARPHFVVDGNQNGSTGVGNGTRVPFNDVVRDYGGNFDTSNYFFLTPVTGVYMFYTQFYTYHSGTVTYDFRFYSHDTSDSNGVILARVRETWDGGKTMTMQTISYLTANRRISIYNESGASRDTYFNDQNHSFIAGCLIG